MQVREEAVAELAWRRAQLVLYETWRTSIDEAVKAIRNVHDFVRRPKAVDACRDATSALLDELGDVVESIEKLEGEVHVLEEGGDPEELRPKAAVLHFARAGGRS